MSTAPSSSVDGAISGSTIMIKQEPQDETVRDDDAHEYGKTKDVETSQLPAPVNDAVHHADVESVSIVPGKVKQEKVDATDLECSKCKVQFQDNGELQKHVCTVISEWSCQDCNRYFKTRANLRKHKKYHCHKKSSSFVCRKCGKIFSSITEMAQHQKMHLRICMFLQEDSLYTCTVCSKKFAARSMLEMHKKSHSSGSLYVNHTEEISVQPSISTGKVLLKRFKCHYCPKSYTERSKLKLHVKVHSVGKNNSSMSEQFVETKQSNKSDIAGDAMPECSKMFTCKYCQHVFAHSAALWNHMLQQHITDKAYRCDACGRSFSHLKAYSSHKKIHLKTNCRVCGQQCTSEKALREHEYNKHSIQKATHHCRQCTESFMTRSELLIHGRTHRKKGKISAPVVEESEVKTLSLPCSLCSERFPTPVALVAHMQMHIGMDTGNRNMGSSNISNLNQGPMPQSSSWEEGERSLSLTCKICSRLFDSMSSLQRHIKVHATGRHVFYPCKICGKKFVSESTYKTHMATHASKSFHCDSCNKMFLNKESFKCHICENTEKQPCLKCGILLTEEQRLNHDCDDNISKSLELPGRCNICSAVFSSVNARNSHMRIHGNQMNLPSFKKITKLSNGMYKCNVCGKMATTQQGAASHTKTHNYTQPAKAYSCPFCKRKYSTESGLYTHITVEHPELPSKFL